MRRLLSTSLVVVLLLVCTSERSYSDAGSTGKAIGTAINSAITAAFPGVMSVINAIWPSNSSDKKTKTDATNGKKSPSVQDLQNKATQGLQDLKKITADLDVVTLFISSSITAENSVVSMRAMLVGKTSLSDADKLQLNQYWSPAKEALTGLKNSGTQIDALQDPTTQSTFRAVAKAAGIVDNIDNQIKAGDAGLGLLSKNLEKLDDQLSAVNALSGEIIEDISFGLKQATNAASGKQSEVVQSDELKKAKTTFSDILKSKLAVQ